MSQGIKVAKDGFSVESNNPVGIAVDSRDAGAMKVAKKIILKQIPANETSTKLNAGGILVGTYQYEHKLGYAPAFLAYQITVDTTVTPNRKQAILLPTLGPLFSGNQAVTSDKKYVTVNNLYADPGDIGFGVDYYLALYVFAEDLDATV